MEIPDHEDHEDITIFTLGEGAAGVEEPELHRLLRGIADEVVPAPRGDFYPQVIKRATAIRKRRRAVRASTATAVLAAAIVLGPAVGREVGVGLHRGRRWPRRLRRWWIWRVLIRRRSRVMRRWCLRGRCGRGML
ncbi:hypothetical protein ACFQ9X_47530 [Catenulispora yoronensis]